MNIPDGATHVYTENDEQFPLRKDGEDWLIPMSDSWAKIGSQYQNHLNNNPHAIQPITDNVNQPLHYTQGKVECIDAIESATVGKCGFESYCVGNVIKYLWRYEQKGGKESVEKAKWHLQKLLDSIG